jgi:hypothetical protein
MKSKGFWCVAGIAILVTAISVASLAQTQNPVHFRGTINDFTPANVGGPWQVSGTWSLKLNGDSGTADFSAALTMVRSDLGVTDLNSAAQRKAHTHHVILVGGTVTPIAGGFQVTGPVTITGNGTYPPPFGPSSTATINITGGNTVTFSNIQLILSGDAATHFGSQAINGVVHNVK